MRAMAINGFDHETFCTVYKKQWCREDLVRVGHKTTRKLFVAYKMTRNNTVNLERQLCKVAVRLRSSTVN